MTAAEGLTPPSGADGRMTLTAFLEFQRATTAHGGRASTRDLLADVFCPQPITRSATM